MTHTFYEATLIYKQAAQMSLTPHRITHPLFREFSFQLQDFIRKLGDEIEIADWKRFVRRLKRFRFEQLAAPLGFSNPLIMPPNDLEDLAVLIDEYENWIDEKHIEISGLDAKYRAAAERYLNECSACAKRMREGLVFASLFGDLHSAEKRELSTRTARIFAPSRNRQKNRKAKQVKQRKIYNRRCARRFQAAAFRLYRRTSRGSIKNYF